MVFWGIRAVCVWSQVSRQILTRYDVSEDEAIGILLKSDVFKERFVDPGEKHNFDEVESIFGELLGERKDLVPRKHAVSRDNIDLKLCHIVDYAEVRDVDLQTVWDLFNESGYFNLIRYAPFSLSEQCGSNVVECFDYFVAHRDRWAGVN